jgi:hypothetical protein
LTRKHQPPAKQNRRRNLSPKRPHIVQFPPIVDVAPLPYDVVGPGQLFRRVPLRTSPLHKQECRQNAATLWGCDPTLTIEDVINRLQAGRFSYSRGVLRSWIKELCPNRRPGRRPKKN